MSYNIKFVKFLSQGQLLINTALVDFYVPYHLLIYVVGVKTTPIFFHKKTINWRVFDVVVQLNIAWFLFLDLFKVIQIFV
jgi:hypothetical protein